MILCIVVLILGLAVLLFNVKVDMRTKEYCIDVRVLLVCVLVSWTSVILIVQKMWNMYVG